MKFGKEFQQILDESKFPDEWKSSAIEYRQVSITLNSDPVKCIDAGTDVYGRRSD